MTAKNKLVGRGIRAADSRMFRQDKIRSRYSDDKVDIGRVLTGVLRRLHMLVILGPGRPENRSE
jgi:hypothetical protein